MQEVPAQMREARQEDKLQAILTLRFAGAAAFNKSHVGVEVLDQLLPPAAC